MRRPRRNFARFARSGPSQRLLRHCCAITCIRRAPSPAPVRGWTGPPGPRTAAPSHSQAPAERDCSTATGTRGGPFNRAPRSAPVTAAARILRRWCRLDPHPKNGMKPDCGQNRRLRVEKRPYFNFKGRKKRGSGRKTRHFELQVTVCAPGPGPFQKTVVPKKGGFSVQPRSQNQSLKWFDNC